MDEAAYSHLAARPGLPDGRANESSASSGIHVGDNDICAMRRTGERERLSDAGRRAELSR
jgi:hypothetical protein